MSRINVRKRGKTWEYYFEIAQIEGKRKRISHGGYITKREANDAGIKAMNDYQNAGNKYISTNLSVHDYLNYWLQMYCVPNLKPTTVAGYTKLIRLHIMPKIGKYRLDRVSSEQLQTLINDMVAKGYSKNTVISVKGILSGSFNYAVHPLRYIKASPMVFVKIPKGSRSDYKSAQHTRDVIEKEIIDRIFERFPKGSSTFLPMLFAYRCGMRLGEAYAVTWENIDFENKKITIDKQLQWNTENNTWYLTPPKYNSFRTIDIDMFLLGLLAELKEEQAKNKMFYADEYKTIYHDEINGINYSNGDIVQFVNVYEDGSYIQPRTMQHTSAVIHQFYPRFNFHSL